MGAGFSATEGNMTLRRDVLKAGLGGIAATLFGAGRAVIAQPAAASDLGGGVHVLTIGERNFAAATGGDGAVLVNGGSTASSAALLDAVARLPGGGAVRTLFNTCWHPEHTGSNAALAKAGATIIAHENTRLWMTQRITWPWDGERFEPLPASERPNKTFY